MTLAYYSRISNPMTPDERCESAMTELDEILARYKVCLSIDPEQGDVYMVPAEEDALVIEPNKVLH